MHSQHSARGSSDSEYSESVQSEYDQRAGYGQFSVVRELSTYARFASATHSSADAAAPLRQNNSLDVYQKYQFTRKINFTGVVPIDFFEKDVIRAMNNNKVVIIRGPTGCGKSTQVPQFILDDCKDKNELCNIVVTQPRKIAAVSTAERVCEERKWPLGSVCGYQVRLEKKVSSETLLTYMTVGVLLEKVLADESLNRFTHIVIDDAHERNQELDFLLMVVRKFMFTNNVNTKVILMSASIEAEELAHYFKVSLLPPIIEVDINYCFFNPIFYIEDCIRLLEKEGPILIPTFDIEKPEISEEAWKIFTSLLSLFDKLDESINSNANEWKTGGVLVFLPGLSDIETAKKYLFKAREGEEEESEITWAVFVLHSNLTNEEQRNVLSRQVPGYRKVILATNIAESSITIPDCFYVIDFCQTKIMAVDLTTKYTNLKLEWASHVNCEQRAGRVGRVGQGRVYRLVSKYFYEQKMASKSPPEIMKAPLERVVLQAKILDKKQSPHEVLALTLNPPTLRRIKNTILNLQEMGGLSRTCNGDLSCIDGNLTFLGIVMAALPIDVRLSKLIVLGYLTGCYEQAIIIAAGCTVRNIFQQKFCAYKKQLMWSEGSSNDFKTMLNIFTAWKTYEMDPPYADWDVDSWCNTNKMNLKQLKEWDSLVTDIRKRLERINIKDISGLSWHDEKSAVLDIILAGAFYPNFFLKVPDSEIYNEREAVKIVNRRDPSRTVYFTGMALNQPNVLYIKQIKCMLRNGNDEESDTMVGFNDSGKIFVQFKAIERLLRPEVSSQAVQTSRPGKIPIEVYEAIRERQLNRVFNLSVLPQNVAWKWAKQNGFSKSTLQHIIKNNCSSATEFSPLPMLDVKWVNIKITQHIDLGYFWAITKECEQAVIEISEILNSESLRPVLAAGGILKMGSIYAAKFHGDEMFYRCRIVSTDSNAVLVIFVDYGSMQQVNHHDICYLPDRVECNMAPLALECVLHGIQACRKQNYKGVWDETAYNIFMNDASEFWIWGKIHSTVHDVLHLELFIDKPSGNKHESINKILLKNGYAEPAEESFLSKEDHESRRSVQEARYSNMQAFRWNFDDIINYQDLDTPKGITEHHIVQLKGPYSPLEIKVSGCTSSSAKMQVVIEDSSVNSVLLDTEPRNPHTRLLVAGNVCQTEEDRLRLRQTAMLPGIPGLPMLMALLFCPTTRVKLAEDGTRVSSILCGLGYNHWEDKPYNRAHDLVLNLDTELTPDDICNINEIRSLMNQGIKLMGQISRGRGIEEDMIGIRNHLNRKLTDLIFVPRKSVDKVYVRSTRSWEKKKTDALNVSLYSGKAIWPPLQFPNLREERT